MPMTNRPLKEFLHRDDLNIFVHPDESTTQYRDGGEEYILEVLKKAREINACSSDFSKYIRDWPSRYHLSLKRINLLESVREILNRDSKVLEIGCGTGVITRWLGEHLGVVDAIEGAQFRALITRHRTKDLGNVNIYCGNLLNTTFPPKAYDLIAIVGVLEYIPFYDPTMANPVDACREFLNRMSASLNKNGILLLAMENKFGVKYLTGCKEDHTGKLYEGLCDYPRNTPTTFSRNELEEILSLSGFENVQFYHLFPDYKLLETVIKEDDAVLSLYPHNWIRTPFEDYSGYRLYGIPEPLFLRSVTHAKLLWHLSNSFLVLCSKSKNINLKTEWLIRKFSTHDNLMPIFSHTVTLKRDENDGAKVVREPIYRGDWNERIEDIEYSIESESEFVSGDSLAIELYKAVLSDDCEEKITSILRHLNETLLAHFSTGKVNKEGYHLVSGDAVDYTFFNIIKTEDGDLRFVDRKWTFKSQLPADYILFRNVFHLHTFLRPFVLEKDLRRFTLGIMTGIYPDYTPGRVQKCFSLEEEFQSTVNIDDVRISLDPPAIYSLEQTLDVYKMALAKQDEDLQKLSMEVKERDRQLEGVSQTVKKMNEGLAILKRLIDRLMMENASAQLLADAGELCRKLGMMESARAFFEKSLAADPKNADEKRLSGPKP
jgi:SAM-dependent methyltransferase